MFDSRTVFVCVLCLWSACAAAQPDSNAWVEAADAYRLNSDSSRVTTRVILYKNGKQTKERLYRVYMRPERKSLVLFQSSGEKGQKVLMLADKFWLLMPSSRRPIRITPMQKLLGEASTGDIATMSWHQDYDAEHVSTESVDGIMVDHLLLTAVSKGVSYKTINLYLEPETHKPVSAELFTSSGKLAKTAHFDIENKDGRERVVRMTLTDAIQTNRVTEVEYVDSEPFELAEKYYNPQYLSRNRQLSIE